jgi:hypothetical protein
MKNQFDELAKGMAQSVTRRQALKKFGVGVAGMALACFGLASIAKAGRVKPPPPPAPACCLTDSDCGSAEVCDFNIPCTTKKDNKVHQYGTCHCIQCPG